MNVLSGGPAGVPELGEAQRARSIHARWVITGEAVLLSATHLGGFGDQLTDMPLLRDVRDGVPLLPGTTLAGALRSHLADVLGGYRSKEDARVAGLFGGRRGDDLGGQSPLIVFDSFGGLPAGRASEIRDGVAIDPASGTAEEHKKFDVEVLPAGTTFPLRLELIVEAPADEVGLITLLRASLSGLAASELCLGARRSRGLGRLAARAWRAWRYDFSEATGCLAWMLSDPRRPIPDDVPGADDVDAALTRAWPAFSPAPITDRRQRVGVDVALTFTSGLLVRSPGTTPDAPDAVHLHSGGHPILPGTSVAGALRARALRIGRHVRARHGDAERWVTDLFGPRLEGTTAHDGFVPHGSRLRIAETTLAHGVPMRTTRVGIDRFTQGVVPRALFDEEPDHGGRVTVHLELRNPQPGETGLLLLLLKDLLSGDLALGGTASVGRGVARGSATVRLDDGSEFKIEPGEPLDAASLRRVNALIRELHEAVRPSTNDGGTES